MLSDTINSCIFTHFFSFYLIIYINIIFSFDLFKYITQAKSNSKLSVKQYFLSKAKNILLSSPPATLHDNKELLDEINNVISSTSCFTKEESSLSPTYISMMESRDENISFDKNLFFGNGGLMINWDYWRIENMARI